MEEEEEETLFAASEQVPPIARPDRQASTGRGD